MSSRTVESELISVYCKLQRDGRHSDAAILDIGIYNAKGYLPHLLELRHQWEHLIEVKS